MSAKRIWILNGPNLNLVGKREPDVYGNTSIDAFLEELSVVYQADAQLTMKQTNVEGELVNFLQEAEQKADGVLLNAGGYTHTSVAIRDAIAAIDLPVVEVHISNPYVREGFRQTSLLAPVCKGMIAGFGLESYVLGLDALLTLLKN